MVKKLIKLIAISLFSITISTAQTATDRLTQLLSQMSTMQAGFTQVVLDKKGRALMTSRGQMFISRPGKFRWEVQTPTHQLLVADGEHLWFYDKDIQQVTVQNQKGLMEKTPAMLLSGNLSTLAENFNISSSQGEQGVEIFELHPKTEGIQLFESVKLFFRNNQITAMRLIDSLGQASQLQFLQIRLQPNLSQTLFSFSPPKGVDVIKQ